MNRAAGAELQQRSGGAEVSEEIKRAPQDLVSPAPPLPYSSTPFRPPSTSLVVAPSLILGIPIANLSEDEAVEAIDTLIAEGGSHYCAVVNAAKLVAANRDQELRRALLDADMVTADGMSVVWASRLLKQGLKERVTGIDLFERLIELAARRNFAVFFLGAREESVRGTVEHFSRRYPALLIAGYRNGYFEASESRSVCEAIKLSGADLLFVAMGSPRQENWISSNLALTGVGFAMGVGGSIDHLSGRAQRAPRWMQKSGLEWLHRLAQEPHRLWRRYLIGNAAFTWLVVRQRFRGNRPVKQK